MKRWMVWAVFAIIHFVGNSIVWGQSGSVRSWGNNSNGELGDGTTTHRKISTRVRNLENIVAVSAGGFHSLALANNGTVWAWGSNISGQLGNSSKTSSTIPVQVQGLANVTKVSAGGDHSLALKSDGSVWSWGRNDGGQLGNNTTVESSVAVPVSGLTNVTNISAGNDLNLALKSDGTVWFWGYAGIGAPASASSKVPLQMSGLNNVTAIAAGYSHRLAVKSDGTVWAWGSNDYGELGNVTNTRSDTPVQVSGLSGCTSVAAGGSFTLARKNDGTVWSWGLNDYGQLGHGSSNSSPNSVPVEINNLTGVVNISAGIDSSFAVKNDGTLWAWGYNGNIGKLGNNSTIHSYVPTQVLNVTGFTDAEAGRNYTLVCGNFLGISADSVTVQESSSGTTASIPVHLSAASANTVQVNFATSDGSALASSDYQSTSGSLTFAPGETSKTIDLPITGDTLYEGDETFTLNLSGASNAVLDNTQTSVTIRNAAPTTLSLNIVPSTFSESATSNAAVGTVALDAAFNTNITVTLSSSNTGAATVPASVVILAGSLSANFNIDATNDTLVDGSQSSSLTATAQGLTSGNAVVTATDDEQPSLTLSIEPNTFSETSGNQAAIGTVNIAPSSFTTTVNLSCNDANLIQIPASITIPAGSTSSDFWIGVTDDNIVNGSRTVLVNASTINLTRQKVLQVTDNDVAPTPTSLPTPTPTATPVPTVTPTPTATPILAPVNDNFSSRSPLPATGPVFGTSNFATPETGEPSHDGRGARKTVWFEWRISSMNGNATISTQGSSFNTVLAVYEGTTNPAVVNRLKPIVSDANGSNTSITFPARVGVPYYIALDGVNGASGNYKLSYKVGLATSPTISWTRAVSGRWNDPNNWTDVLGVKHVPGPADVVAIAVPGTYQVQLDVEATVAGFASLGGATGVQTLLISGAPLTVTGDSRMVTGGKIRLTGGTLNNRGNFSIPSGKFEWIGGKIDGEGSIKLLGTGRLEVRQLPNTALKYLHRQKIFNSSFVDWYDATIYAGLGAEMNNQAGGRWRFFVIPDAPAQLTPQIIPNGGGNPPKFTNLTGGIIENEDGSLSPLYKRDATYRRSFLAPDGKPLGKRAGVQFPPTWFNPPVDNFGTMRSNTGGGFEFRSGGSNGGAITVNNAARARFRGGTMTFERFNSILNGNGSVEMNGGTLQTQGAGVNIGTSNSQLATGATLSGNRDIVVGGLTSSRLTWNGGTMSRSAGSTTVERTLVNRNATIEVQSGSLNGRALDVNGTFFCNGTLNTQNGAVIENRYQLLSKPGAAIRTTSGAPVTLRNHAQLNPGNTSTTSGAVGALSVTGNLQLMPTSRINIDVRGISAGLFDTLTGMQSVTLGGTLQINSTVSPPENTQIRIISGARRSSNFAAVVSPRLPNGLYWNVVSDTTGTFLRAERASMSPRIANSARPQIEFVTPTDGTLVRNLGEVAGRVIDCNGAGIERVTLNIRREDGLSWNGHAWISERAELKAVLNGARWTVQTQLPSTSGTYTLTATARDNGTGENSSRIEVQLRPEPARPTSTTTTPAARVSQIVAGTDAIEIFFVTPVQISGARFEVWRDNRNLDIESVRIDASGRRVTLTLPTSTCRTGDTLNVQWSGLKTAAGSVLAAGQTQVVVR